MIGDIIFGLFLLGWLICGFFNRRYIERSSFWNFPTLWEPGKDKVFAYIFGYMMGIVGIFVLCGSKYKDEAPYFCAPIPKIVYESFSAKTKRDNSYYMNEARRHFKLL